MLEAYDIVYCRRYKKALFKLKDEYNGTKR